MIRKNFKQAILAIAKPLLWASYKSLYRALDVLLSPCCDLTGTAEAECNDDVYTITVTTDPSIGFLGEGTAIANINRVFAVGTVTEPNTIVFEGVSISAGTYDVEVFVLLPTNSEDTMGAYKTFTIEDVEFAACA